MRSRLEEVRAELVQLVARLAVHLATVPAPAGLPDYFGEGYARLAEESYSAMVNGKEELFKKLFPPFFLSGLTAHDRLREQLREHDQERALIYATEPLADLLELSGHAIIYSELDQKTFWDTAKRLWDAYFDQMPDRAAGTRFIHAMVEYRRSLFALLPRGLARTSWKQGLEHRLRKEGLMEDMFERRLSGKGRPPHQSAVIRALARGNFLYEEPTDVFMVIYLGRRPEAAGLELGHRAESFVRSLQREESGEENENGMEGFDL
jgi:hypothetical protein